MGRTRLKKKVHSKAKDLLLESKKAPSTASLLAKAQSLIEQCDYDLALRFIYRILDQDPKNAEAKEMLGIALLETGEIEGAKQVSYEEKKSQQLQIQNFYDSVGISGAIASKSTRSLTTTSICPSLSCTTERR